MRKTLVMIVLACLVACQQSELEKASAPVVESMSWLYDADPYADLDAALRKGDYRFVGLYGVARYVPGLDEECAEKLQNVRMIEGTSDAILGYEHEKLIAIASAYARQYNINLQVRLLDQGMDPCNA